VDLPTLLLEVKHLLECILDQPPLLGLSINFQARQQS
jgi:hypothetical protein